MTEMCLAGMLFFCFVFFSVTLCATLIMDTLLYLKHLLTSVTAKEKSLTVSVPSLNNSLSPIVLGWNRWRHEEMAAFSILSPPHCLLHPVA